MMTGFSSLMGNRVLRGAWGAAVAPAAGAAPFVADAWCMTGGDVMVKWQPPVLSFAAEELSSGVGAGVWLGAACSAGGFCAVCSSGAWLDTSGALRNK